MSQKEFFNKKSGFDYDIAESLEAGIVLNGLEIKAIRNGRVNITGSHVRILNGEAFWVGGDFNIEGDKQRTKKLLLHKEQLNRLIGKSKEDGLSVIPQKLYIKKGRAKLLIGTGKGKKKYDKREIIKKRDVEREQGREFKKS